MSITLREGTAADAEACGTICYEAFKSVCSAHNFPPDFPSPEAGIGQTVQPSRPVWQQVDRRLHRQPLHRFCQRVPCALPQHEARNLTRAGVAVQNRAGRFDQCGRLGSAARHGVSTQAHTDCRHLPEILILPRL